MSEDGGGWRHGGDGGAAHGGLPSRPSEDVEVRGKTKLDLRSKLQYKVNMQYARASKAPSRYFACSSLVLYGIRAPIIEPFHT